MNNIEVFHYMHFMHLKMPNKFIKTVSKLDGKSLLYYFFLQFLIWAYFSSSNTEKAGQDPVPIYYSESLV